MKIVKKTLLFLLLAFVALLIGFNLWGAATLGTMTPAKTAERDMSANRVVMVMGATGRVFMSGSVEDMTRARDRIAEVLKKIKGRSSK